MFHFLLAFVFATVTVYDKGPPPIVGIGNNEPNAQKHIDMLKTWKAFDYSFKNFPQTEVGITYTADLSTGYTFCKSQAFNSTWFTVLSGANLTTAQIKDGVNALILEHTKVFDRSNNVIQSYAQQTHVKPYTQQPVLATALSPVQQSAATSAASVQSTQPVYTHVVSFGPSGNLNNPLSNYYLEEVEVEGVKYKSGEHAYQCFKFIPNTVEWHAVYNAASPNDARKQGQNTNNRKLQHSGWYQEIKEWMNKIVRAKYAQNQEVQDIINKNRDAYFVEDTGDRELPGASKQNPVDRIWGIALDTMGSNQLGLLWTLVAQNKPFKGKLPNTAKLTREQRTNGTLGKLALAQQIAATYPQQPVYVPSASAAAATAASWGSPTSLQQYGITKMERYGRQDPQELWVTTNSTQSASALLKAVQQENFLDAYIRRAPENNVVIINPADIARFQQLFKL